MDITGSGTGGNVLFLDVRTDGVCSAFALYGEGLEIRQLGVSMVC